MREYLLTLALIGGVSPTLLHAQYSEIKMGEYLHSATAAANGGIYAGYDSIGYSYPSMYTPSNGWTDLPSSIGFNTSQQIYGAANAISHDGTVVAGYVVGTPPGGIAKQCAVYWVNGVENVIPAPPDDPGAAEMTVTAVSGDGTTLLVQDGSVYGTNVETYIYSIATGTFTSLGFLGSSTRQTFATAINKNGTVVAGYSSLDNGNLSGFIWSASNGLTVLPIPAAHPATAYLEPTCMSDDGATVYGRLTEFNGWIGFQYNATNGYVDLGDLSPSACTADGLEVVGIQNMYFPAVWTAKNGGGYLDHLMSANGTTQALGTLSGPVTISPDGSAITGSGPDVYLTDQIWSGVWQITAPVPLKAAAIPPALLNFTTDYQTTLTEPAGTLTAYAEFNVGVSAILVHGPHYASSFALHADGSFVYTPKPGYISQGVDPEDGTPVDSFTYQLTSPNGTSSNATVRITVLAPAAPTVDTPTYANVTTTTASLGGTIEDNGGMAVTAAGIVFAPTSVNNNPQLGGAGVSSATTSITAGAFAVGVSNLLPNTTYSYAAYAVNSVGTNYSAVDSFTTLATFESWQVLWYGSAGSSNALPNADPYHTGVPNIAVFAFLGPNQDPQSASPAMLPQVQLSGGNLLYDFFEPAGVSGITYGANTTGDLGSGNWQAVPDTGTSPEHIFSVPINANSQGFMRLTLTAQ